MPGDRDHGQRAGAHGDAVALAHGPVDGYAGLLGDRRGVRRPGDDRGTGGRDDVRERAVVVPVLVRGDDGRQPRLAHQGEQPGAEEAASISTCSRWCGTAGGSNCSTSARRRRAWRSSGPPAAHVRGASGVTCPCRSSCSDPRQVAAVAGEVGAVPASAEPPAEVGGRAGHRRQPLAAAPGVVEVRRVNGERRLGLTSERGLDDRPGDVPGQRDRS